VRNENCRRKGVDTDERVVVIGGQSRMEKTFVMRKTQWKCGKVAQSSCCHIRLFAGGLPS
jgi:hypothetical protein